MAVILSFVGKWNGSDLKKADVELAKMRQHSDYNKISLKNLGLAAVTAGAAIGGMAIAIGVDAVKAAIEEEKSVAALSQTMKNLGMAAQDSSMQQWIDDLQFSTGVADDLVRGPMARLLVATKDVTKAQDAMSLALDLSAQGFGSVDAIATGLSKAYGGNLTALKRLGIPMDATKVKAGDLDGVLADLAQTSSGQAAKAAGTLGGQLKILSIGVDELKESAGKGFLKGLMGDPASTTKGTQELTDNLREMQGSVESISETIGAFVKGAVDGFIWVKKAIETIIMTAFDLDDAWSRLMINMDDFFGFITDEEADAQRKLLDVQSAARKAAADAEGYGFAAEGAAAATKELGGNADTAASAVEGLGGASATADGSVSGLASSFDSVLNNANGAKSAVEGLKSALDKLTGAPRTVRQTEADYFAAVRDAAKVGQIDRKGLTRKGAPTHRRPRLNANGGLDLSTALGAEANANLSAIGLSAEERAAAILAAGGPNAVERAAAALAQGRTDVRRQARAYGMDNFATYLPRTPQDLTQRLENRARAESVTNNYYFGDIKVDSIPDAVKAAEQARRLRMLNNRATNRGALAALGAA